MSEFHHADTPLLLAPLSLVRGGSYSCNTGSLFNQSGLGFYWSRRLDNTINGNFLFFYSGYPGYVGPQYNYDRGNGLSLRCPAR